MRCLFPLTIFFLNFCTISITLHPGTIVCDFLWEPALSWSLVHKVWMEQLSGVNIGYCSYTEEVMVCSIGCSPYHSVQGPSCYASSPLWPYFLPFSPLFAVSPPTSVCLLCLLSSSPGLLFLQTATWLFLHFILISVQISVLKETFPGHPH